MVKISEVGKMCGVVIGSKNSSGKEGGSFFQIDLFSTAQKPTNRVGVFLNSSDRITLKITVELSKYGRK